MPVFHIVSFISRKGSKFSAKYNKINKSSLKLQSTFARTITVHRECKQISIQEQTAMFTTAAKAPENARIKEPLSPQKLREAFLFIEARSPSLADRYFDELRETGAITLEDYCTRLQQLAQRKDLHKMVELYRELAKGMLRMARDSSLRRRVWRIMLRTLATVPHDVYRHDDAYISLKEAFEMVLADIEQRNVHDASFTANALIVCGKLRDTAAFYRLVDQIFSHHTVLLKEACVDAALVGSELLDSVEPGCFKSVLERFFSQKESALSGALFLSALIRYIDFCLRHPGDHVSKENLQATLDKFAPRLSPYQMNLARRQIEKIGSSVSLQRGSLTQQLEISAKYSMISLYLSISQKFKLRKPDEHGRPLASSAKMLIRQLRDIYHQHRLNPGSSLQWNALLAIASLCGFESEVLRCLSLMKSRGIRPSERTFELMSVVASGLPAPIMQHLWLLELIRINGYTVTHNQWARFLALTLNNDERQYVAYMAGNIALRKPLLSNVLSANELSMYVGRVMEPSKQLTVLLKQAPLLCHRLNRLMGTELRNPHLMSIDMLLKQLYSHMFFVKSTLRDRWLFSARILNLESAGAASPLKMAFGKCGE